MEAATATPAPPAILHPQAVAFTGEARQIERRAGFMFGLTGIALVAAMGVLGLLMRFTQADETGLSPAWFYRLMTLHGVGMITGALLVMMGALWYVLHPVVPLRPGRMYASYTLVVGGAVAVLVATLVGGFGAGWTFLPPLPFSPGGTVAGLVGEPLPRGQSPRRDRVLRLLPRRARADDDSLRGPRPGPRLAVPARARVGGATAAGDRSHRGRDRRPALDGGRLGDRARPARPHLRLGGRFRRARGEEPRLLLRPLDRKSRHLPRCCGGIRDPAALRRSSVSRRRRYSSPPGRGRSSSSPPRSRTTCTWTSCSRCGRRSARSSPPTPRCSRSP